MPFRTTPADLLAITYEPAQRLLYGCWKKPVTETHLYAHYAELVAAAVDAGRISARRAAGLLDLAVDDLTEAFAAHGVAFDPGL